MDACLFRDEKSDLPLSKPLTAYGWLWVIRRRNPGAEIPFENGESALRQLGEYSPKRDGRSHEWEYAGSRSHHYQVQVIPGLLQTPDFARALFDVVPTYRPREWVDEHIDTRIKRQHILTRQRPPEACFVLDEAALRRLPKEPAVTREQLRHILKMCELPNLTVQIVPFSRGMHAMLDGSMTLLGFDEGDDCVYVEPVGSGMVYSDAVGVASARRRYDALRAEGLPPAETAQMIISMMESL